MVREDKSMIEYKYTCAKCNAETHIHTTEEYHIGDTIRCDNCLSEYEIAGEFIQLFITPKKELDTTNQQQYTINRRQRKWLNNQ